MNFLVANTGEKKKMKRHDDKEINDHFSLQFFHSFSDDESHRESSQRKKREKVKQLLKMKKREITGMEANEKVKVTTPRRPSITGK
jgi:hypothetical protein